MVKNMLFVAAMAALLVSGSYVLSSAPVCSPSRADVLTPGGAQDRLPTCSPSRTDILAGQTSP